MQFNDLGAQYNVLKNEIDENIRRVIEGGQFILGSQVQELEEKLCEFVGVKNTVTCANGTDALQILYMAYGIGKGDAVFCPDVTFIASIEPAVMLGATPVFCDITADTYNLCPVSLEKQIKAVISEGKLNPKAVVAVDLLGNPADYDKISAVCKKYNLILIEDAAQSMGASYKGKRCGSFGGSAITSFFPSKPLGCYGDGGAIFTNDDEIAKICRSIRVHGKGTSKYDNIRIGVNSRLDTLQAGILLLKLVALKACEIERRGEVARKYNQAFADRFVTPHIEQDSASVYAQYALLAQSREERDGIMEHLVKKGIPSMVYYPTPQHKLPVFAGVNSYGEDFANSIDYCNRTFSLPMSPYLSDGDIIIENVLKVS